MLEKITKGVLWILGITSGISMLILAVALFISRNNEFEWENKCANIFMLVIYIGLGVILAYWMWEQVTIARYFRVIVLGVSGLFISFGLINFVQSFPKDQWDAMTLTYTVIIAVFSWIKKIL